MSILLLLIFQWRGWDVNDGGDGELNTWSAKEVVTYLEFSKLSKP